MSDVRRRIDDLDRELVELMARRQRMIAEAGRTKTRREHVRDDARVEEVMRLVLEESARRGLSADIAEAVWRPLMERSIAFEYSVFDDTERRTHTPVPATESSSAARDDDMSPGRTPRRA